MKKSIKSIIVFAITVFMITTLFAACGDKGAQQSDAGQTTLETSGQEASTQAQTSKPETAAAVFPLKVTDALGAEMTIEKEPANIISLTLGSDEMLMGLVDKSRIKALTVYAEDAGISNIAEEAKAIPERASLKSIEKIIELQPDLVVTDTWTDPKEVQQLRDARITVYVFATPNNYETQKKVIMELARVVGAEEKGTELTAWMDEKLKAVEEKLASVAPENKLRVMDYGEMGSSGIGTNFDDIVTRAGLINVVAEAGMKDWPTLTKEQMIELNPDIIVLPSWYYDSKNSLQGMKDRLKNDTSLATINAIKNDRLISVPNPHVSAVSQYVVLGIEDVAAAAYPELFK